MAWLSYLFRIFAVIPLHLVASHPSAARARDEWGGEKKKGFGKIHITYLVHELCMRTPDDNQQPNRLTGLAWASRRANRNGTGRGC